MRAQDPIYQSDQPAVPLTFRAPEPPDLDQEQQQQRLVAMECYICFDDIQPNEPVKQCQQCRNRNHTSCTIQWLVYRRNQRQEPSCPICRVDMTWILEELPGLPRCAWCEQHIGPNARRIFCCACTVFHRDEIVTCVSQMNNAGQVFLCRCCSEDMIWVLDLPAPDIPLHDLNIQPAALNNDIDNFSYEDSQSESESESDTD